MLSNGNNHRLGQTSVNELQMLIHDLEITNKLEQIETIETIDVEENIIAPNDEIIEEETIVVEVVDETTAITEMLESVTIQSVSEQINAIENSLTKRKPLNKLKSVKW